jgi:regulator of sirC expression with transglutaminase-like and TPR domain
MGKHYILFLLSTGLLCISCNPVNQRGYLTNELLKISEETEIKFLGNNPNLSVYQQEIAAIAGSIGNKFKENPSEDILNIMNRTIFDDLGIQPMPDSINITFDCLTVLLKTRKASCVGLTSLYLALAEQLDLPLYGVLVPGHVFVRYQSDSICINVETLRKGVQRTDEFYRDYFKPNPGTKYYMRNLSKKEFIAICLFNLGNEYAKRGLDENAIDKYNSVCRLFPDFEEAKDNLKNASFQRQRSLF